MTPDAPPEAPNAINDLVATKGDEEVTLTLTAPDDGGSPIIDYEYQKDSDAYVAIGSTDTEFTVTGLNNGEEYSFTVRAVNAIGSAPDSNLSYPHQLFQMLLMI